MRSHWVALVLGFTLVAAVTAAAPAASEPQLAAGSLDFQASFGLVTDPAPCPAGVSPATTECRSRIGQARSRTVGLRDSSSVTYFWPARGRAARPVPRTSPSRSRPPAGSASHGKGDDHLHVRRGSTALRGT